MCNLRGSGSGLIQITRGFDPAPGAIKRQSAFDLNRYSESLESEYILNPPPSGPAFPDHVGTTV